MDQEPLIENKEINKKKIDLLNEKEENNLFYKMNESQLKDYLIQFLNNNTIAEMNKAKCLMMEICQVWVR